ncbi:MAG: 2-oxo acid dehydrogenase subunit E2 [Anaerolineae bacterium]
MAFEVVLPRLGWNMEAGSLGEWLKRDGDWVEAGEILFTVEGDKATQEVEALESGILHIPSGSPAPGVEVPVGTLLGYLLAEGEAVPAAPERDVAGGPAGPAATQQPGAARQPAVQPSISPRAERVARELGVDWTLLQGSGRSGRIVERDVRRAAAESPTPGVPPRLRVTPLARRLAVELGVDAEAVAARTPGKRIKRADIEAEVARLKADRAAPVKPSAPAPLPPSVSAPIGAVVPITTVRRLIADRMAASAHTVAAVTLTTEADATEMVRLRRQLKEDGGQPVPSYNDLLAKLCARSLLEHPMVNARFEGDAIVQGASVNIGIAVDSDRGLLVPVLRDVQAKSLRQIAGESAALIQRARVGSLSPDDLRGGTFTITNLGMFEIDAFTPIINLPECAILGVGRIVPKQVVVEVEAGRVAIRHMVFLSLTFDHRLVDGGPAARFLQRVKRYVERPYLWLVE